MMTSALSPVRTVLERMPMRFTSPLTSFELTTSPTWIRALEEQDQAGHEVVHHVLQAEADADAQRAGGMVKRFRSRPITAKAGAACRSQRTNQWTRLEIAYGRPRGSSIVGKTSSRDPRTRRESRNEIQSVIPNAIRSPSVTLIAPEPDRRGETEPTRSTIGSRIWNWYSVARIPEQHARPAQHAPRLRLQQRAVEAHRAQEP